MSEAESAGEDKLSSSPNQDSVSLPPSDMPAAAENCSNPPSGGGKTMTVFGALFGAAAAVPT